MKNNLNQLTKAYNKRLKLLNKTFFKEEAAGLFIFVEHLRYLRDKTILDSANHKSSVLRTKAALIATAVAEFEIYQESQEEKQKEFHWKNFCEFIKLNMEDWVTPNDSI